jgi:hypothetical protein
MKYTIIQHEGKLRMLTKGWPKTPRYYSEDEGPDDGLDEQYKTNMDMQLLNGYNASVTCCIATSIELDPEAAQQVSQIIADRSPNSEMDLVPRKGDEAEKRWKLKSDYPYDVDLDGTLEVYSPLLWYLRRTLVRFVPATPEPPQESQADLLFDLIDLYDEGDQSGDVQRERVLSKFTITRKQ